MVEGGSLENCSTLNRYRRFESYPLRTKKIPLYGGFFLVQSGEDENLQPSADGSTAKTGVLVCLKTNWAVKQYLQFMSNELQVIPPPPQKGRCRMGS